MVQRAAARRTWRRSRRLDSGAYRRRYERGHGRAAAPSAAYDYGDPRGRIELRTALAEYLGRARGVLADPERIVVASGYVQGLALLVGMLGGGRGAAFAMEDPGLPFHREVVRRNGGRVVPPPPTRAAPVRICCRRPAPTSWTRPW